MEDDNSWRENQKKKSCYMEEIKKNKEKSHIDMVERKLDFVTDEYYEH